MPVGREEFHVSVFGGLRVRAFGRCELGGFDAGVVSLFSGTIDQDREGIPSLLCC